MATPTYIHIVSFFYAAFTLFVYSFCVLQRENLYVCYLALVELFDFWFANNRIFSCIQNIGSRRFAFVHFVFLEKKFTRSSVCDFTLTHQKPKINLIIWFTFFRRRGIFFRKESPKDTFSNQYSVVATEAFFSSLSLVLSFTFELSPLQMNEIITRMSVKKQFPYKKSFSFRK